MIIPENYVCTPLNEEGLIECDLAILEESVNIKRFNLSNEDALYLLDNYFDFVNVECDAIIMEQEDEIIPYEKLEVGIEITKILLDNNDDERFQYLVSNILDIFETAFKLKTYVRVTLYGL